MTRDEALQQIHPRLYALLCFMFVKFRTWGPKIGYPSCSAGFNSGGSVSEFTDLEEEIDGVAVRTLEAGWDNLTLAERTAIEVVIGTQPDVWTFRKGVFEEAVRKLEKKLRTIGAI